MAEGGFTEVKAKKRKGDTSDKRTGRPRPTEPHIVTGVNNIQSTMN